MTNTVRNLRIGLVLLSIGFLAAVYFDHATAAKTEVVSNSWQQSAATAPQQAQPVEKTVEQVQKNIQVLKGLPQSQLIPVMNLISASLGVRCNFCHVNNGGQWSFDSDEKPEKQTAREMIKMVLGINKNTFRGSNEVSCYTCHRGKTTPVSVVALPLTETAAVRPAAGASVPAALPTADQILQKYIDALGGTAAIDKLQTRVMKGTYTTSDGAVMTFETYQVAPNKFYGGLTSPLGTFERIFDGTAAWLRNPRGTRELTGQDFADLQRYAQFFKDIKLKDQFARIGGVSRDKIDGRDVYVIRATTFDRRRERLYFDAETGLLLRRVTAYETIVGVIPEQTEFADYSEVDGVKMPSTVRVFSPDPNNTATRKFTEIKFNLPVEDTKFAKPK